MFKNQEKMNWFYKILKWVLFTVIGCYVATFLLGIILAITAAGHDIPMLKDPEAEAYAVGNEMGFDNDEDLEAFVQDMLEFRATHNVDYYRNKRLKGQGKQQEKVTTTATESESKSGVSFRPAVELHNAEIEAEIKNKTAGLSEDEIVDYCEKLTKSLLTFSDDSQLTSLNQLSLNTKIPTHCVGYTRTFVALCNYGFQQNGIDAKCLHAVGPVKFCGIDITKIASATFRKMGNDRMANFCKDHDFAIVHHSDGTQEKVDPLL